MSATVPRWSEWRAGADHLDGDGVSVATYELGSPDGEVVTFLHGYPSSSLDVAPVAASLGAGWRVLALDFPGFGASAKPAGHPYSIHAATDAVERLWRARGVSATVVLAHDYGVSVGQELLARRADGSLAVDLRGVVWTNGGLYPDLHRPTVGQQLLLDPEHGAEVAAAVTEPTFVAAVRGTWGVRQPMDEVAVHEMWCSMDEGGGARLMHELLHYIADRRRHRDRWRAALETPGVPAAFVWGDLDPVSGAHMIERVEDRVPAARVLRMPDVGHWPPLEAPAEVAEAVRYVTAG